MDFTNVDNEKPSENYNLDYYYNHYDNIKASRQQKMKCVYCNKIVTRQSKWAHRKSKVCLRAQGLLEPKNADKDKIIEF